jgi:hypothetical protein
MHIYANVPGFAQTQIGKKYHGFLQDYKTEQRIL